MKKKALLFILMVIINITIQAQSLTVHLTNNTKQDSLKLVYLSSCDDEITKLYHIPIPTKDTTIRMAVHSKNNDFETYELSFSIFRKNLFFSIKDEDAVIHYDMSKHKYYYQIRKPDSIVLFNSPATLENWYFFKSSYNIKKEVYLNKEKLDSLKYSEDEQDRNKYADIIKTNKLRTDSLYYAAIFNSKYSNTPIVALEFYLEGKNLIDYAHVIDSARQLFPDSYNYQWLISHYDNLIKALLKQENLAEIIDFSLNDNSNNLINTKNLRGNYVLLDFWASWCRPCIEQMPNNLKLFDKYKDKNFKLVAVSTDKDKDAWLSAIKKHNMSNVINLIDIEKKISELYSLKTIPTTFLISPEGKILARNKSHAELVKILNNELGL